MSIVVFVIFGALCGGADPRRLGQLAAPRSLGTVRTSWATHNRYRPDHIVAADEPSHWHGNLAGAGALPGRARSCAGFLQHLAHASVSARGFCSTGERNGAADGAAAAGTGYAGCLRGYLDFASHGSHPDIGGRFAPGLPIHSGASCMVVGGVLWTSPGLASAAGLASLLAGGLEHGNGLGIFGMAGIVHFRPGPVFTPGFPRRWPRLLCGC
ncbi:hypothetical protein HRbin36_01380 [bacterium HR36]|nr:hypothetical protein HRbin36_01380 [bacterium HR36]